MSTYGLTLAANMLLISAFQSTYSSISIIIIFHFSDTNSATFYKRDDKIAVFATITAHFTYRLVVIALFSYEITDFTVNIAKYNSFTTNNNYINYFSC